MLYKCYCRYGSLLQWCGSAFSVMIDGAGVLVVMTVIDVGV